MHKDVQLGTATVDVSLLATGFRHIHGWYNLIDFSGEKAGQIKVRYFIILKLYPTNHHSSLEHAIYGTSCLLLAFLNLTTCNLSNLRSIDLILSLSPISCSLSSFNLY